MMKIQPDLHFHMTMRSVSICRIPSAHGPNVKDLTMNYAQTEEVTQKQSQRRISRDKRCSAQRQLCRVMNSLLGSVGTARRKPRGDPHQLSKGTRLKRWCNRWNTTHHSSIMTAEEGGNTRGQHGYSSALRGYSQPQFPQYDNQQFGYSGYQHMGPGY